MRRSLPWTARAVGYQSVGMKPSTDGEPPREMSFQCTGCEEVSSTAIALSEESATNRRLPSLETASAVGELPCCPEGSVLKLTSGGVSVVENASTMSAFDKATYKVF